MSEDYYENKLEAVMRALDEEGLMYTSCLDSAVHDAASEIATSVNNEGTKDQVLFLLGQGWKPGDILFRARDSSDEAG